MRACCSRTTRRSRSMCRVAFSFRCGGHAGSGAMRRWRSSQRVRGSRRGDAGARLVQAGAFERKGNTWPRSGAAPSSRPPSVLALQGCSASARCDRPTPRRRCRAPRPRAGLNRSRPARCRSCPGRFWTRASATAATSRRCRPTGCCTCSASARGSRPPPRRLAAGSAQTVISGATSPVTTSRRVRSWRRTRPTRSWRRGPPPRFTGSSRASRLSATDISGPTRKSNTTGCGRASGCGRRSTRSTKSSPASSRSTCIPTTRRHSARRSRSRGGCAGSRPGSPRRTGNACCRSSTAG